MDALVRNVAPWDREALLELRDLSEDELEARMDDQDMGIADWLLVEGEGEEPVGWVQIFWTRELAGPVAAKVEDLWILSSRRGMGFGSQLLAECEVRARAKGRRKIWLEVNPE